MPIPNRRKKNTFGVKKKPVRQWTKPELKPPREKVPNVLFHYTEKRESFKEGDLLFKFTVPEDAAPHRLCITVSTQEPPCTVHTNGVDVEILTGYETPTRVDLGSLTAGQQLTVVGVGGTGADLQVTLYPGGENG